MEIGKPKIKLEIKIEKPKIKIEQVDVSEVSNINSEITLTEYGKFICANCYKPFSTKSDLKSHYESVHKKIKPIIVKSVIVKDEPKESNDPLNAQNEGFYMRPEDIIGQVSH